MLSCPLGSSPLYVGDGGSRSFAAGARHRSSSRPHSNALPGLQVALGTLIDGSVHEHGPATHRCRTDDGHGHGGRGQARVEAQMSFFMSSRVAIRNTGISSAAVDVRPGVGILSIQRRRIERRRQTRRAVASRRHDHRRDSGSADWSAQAHPTSPANMRVGSSASRR